LESFAKRVKLGYFVYATWHYFLDRAMIDLEENFQGQWKFYLKYFIQFILTLIGPFVSHSEIQRSCESRTKHSWHWSKFVCVLQDKVGREWPITKICNKISHTFEDNCGIVFEKHRHFISRSKLTHYEQFSINKMLGFPFTNLTNSTDVKLYFINLLENSWMQLFYPLFEAFLQLKFK
jgi:hypothetical protein